MTRRAAGVVGTTLLGLVLLGLGTGRGFFFLADADDPPLPLDEEFAEHVRRLRELRSRDRAPSDFRLPDALVLAVQVLAGLALLAVAAAAAYALVRGLRALRLLATRRALGRVETTSYADDSADDDAPTAFRRRLRRSIEEGYAELDAAPTASEAVVACWLRLLAVAGDAGTAPLPAETPEELVVRVLGDHAVPEASLRRLATLYERARFSPHPVDEAMRAEARRCLDDVSGALSGVPA